MLKNLIEKLRDLFPFCEEEVRLGDIMERKISYPPPKPEEEEQAVPHKPSRPFAVYVDDNYHYMDEDARYTAGEFDTWEEAVTLTRKIVDETIVKAIESGSTPEKAIDEYKNFGEDPWISGDGAIPDGDSFSAWTYAETRAIELYELKQRPKKTGRPRRVGLPIKARTLNAKQAGEKLLGILVSNLNANVLKDNPEKPSPGENINMKGKKSD
jgi:hypothetical protein